MPSVVFLRAVNVGTTNRCQPGSIAKQLSKFEVVNIGAVGTFVVRKAAPASMLREAFARKLPFKCEMMICPGRDILRLVSSNPFAEHLSHADIVRFVSIAAKKVPLQAPLPLYLPSDDDWLLQIVDIQGQFVLGLYRRQMKAIGQLGRVEKRFGVPLTARSWNTIEKIAKILEAA